MKINTIKGATVGTIEFDKKSNSLIVIITNSEFVDSISILMSHELQKPAPLVGNQIQCQITEMDYAKIVQALFVNLYLLVS